MHLHPGESRDILARRETPCKPLFSPTSAYFIGGTYGIYRANNQHKKNTTGM
jgi:hypothetical protein